MKKLKTIFLALALGAFVLTGCSKGNTEQASESKPATDKASTENQEASALQGVSQDKPILVDKDKKTVTIYTTLNGKYLTEPTRHLVINNKGDLADMPIFSSYATTDEFYKGLEEIGAEAGNNMTADNAATTLTEGTPLKLTLYWEGNETGTDINDAIADSNGKKIDMRFSGNQKNSQEITTGCISCLDSCFVGITSNASYPLGAIEEKGEVVFKPNAEKLPKDKEAVAIVYSIN